MNNVYEMFYGCLVPPKCYSTTNFGEYEKVYMTTNEELENYAVKDLSNKKVLTVTSSFDHALYAILNGALDITAFDINKLTKFYSELKIAMIKNYDYDEFFNSLLILSDISNNSRKSEDEIVKKILPRLSSDLSDETFLFWNLYYEKFRHSCKILKDIDERNLKFTPYSDACNYKIIKERINNINVNFISSDINKLKNITKYTYDVIFLSNIFDYIYGFKKIKKVLDNILLLTKEESEIYLYSFFVRCISDKVDRLEKDLIAYKDQNSDINLSINNNHGKKIYKIERK